MSAEYRVSLDVFSGPMDLLLYLVRRDELDIQDIPLARVAEQYLDYVRLLEQVDPNAAGDFLVLAATLIEIKSLALLPVAPPELTDNADDPRTLLVRQLLEYKRFKDAARALGSAADERAMRYERVPADLPAELQGVELEEAEAWDLLAAFGRVMSAIGKGPGTHVVNYDETPIALFADEIVTCLVRDGTTTFQRLFAGRDSKAEIIGLFLALLELIREKRIRAEQTRTFGEIYLFLQEAVEDAPLSDDERSALTASDRFAPDAEFEDADELGVVDRLVISETLDDSAAAEVVEDELLLDDESAAIDDPDQAAIDTLDRPLPGNPDRALQSRDWGEWRSDSTAEADPSGNGQATSEDDDADAQRPS